MWTKFQSLPRRIIGRKIALKTGIRYLKTGFKSEIDPISTIHKFIEIPLALRYYYNSKKIRPFSELGVGFLINLNNQLLSIVQNY